MQFLVEYEETLLVATARAGKQVQLFICLCVGSPHFQVLNRRKVSKTSGKIEKPCVCAEKVSVFFPPGPKVYFGSGALLTYTHSI